MKNWCISLVVVVAACGSDDQSSTPHTLTINGGGPSLCPDGNLCPTNGNPPRCSDNSTCLVNLPNAQSDPSGINCGPNMDQTACSAEYASGTAVHLTITKVGTRCFSSTCHLEPADFPDQTTYPCTFDLVMTKDYAVSLVGCFNP